MRNSKKILSEMYFLNMEAINSIKNIVDTRSEGWFDAEENIDERITLWSETDDEDFEHVIVVKSDGSITTSEDNEIHLENLRFDFVIRLLAALEEYFEIGKVVNPEADPSSELVEKYAFIQQLRFDSSEDQKEAYYELKELLQTGQITEAYIESEYHTEMEGNIDFQ